MNCPNCDAPYETTGDEDGFAVCFSCNHEFEFNMTPTPSSLTPTDKIRLVAELDGYKNITKNKYSPTTLGEDEPNERFITLRTAQNAEESSLPLKTGHHPESINPL
jgi:hypothetical protein